MKNFKMKDLMITINPKRSDSNAVYNCENHSKHDDPTNCTSCTHITTGDGTNCTQCTHNTTTTCIPHSKGHKGQMSDSIKIAELAKLKKAIARLQENEYA
jgi:hypothetical protein